MQATFKTCASCGEKTALAGQQSTFNPRSEEGKVVCPECRVAEIINNARAKAISDK